MKKNIQAVIFGFDGVVFYTDIYHFLSWKKSLQIIGVNVDPTFLYKLNGLNRKQSLEEILKSFNIKITNIEKQEILKIKNKIFNKLTKELCEFDVAPGIVELLTHLKKKGIKIALSTTSINSYNIMKKTHMDKYFDYIPTPDEIDLFKGISIDYYDNIIKKLGISQLNMLCIEGSQRGIDTANEMFIKTIGIDYYGNLENSLYTFENTSKLNIESYEKILLDLDEYR